MNKNKTEIVQPPGDYPQEDEISLIDYWRVLVKRKSIIIISGLTAIATIGAVLYALSLTPIYKAKAVFLPPEVSDIQPLLIQGINSDSDTVYTMFKRNLSTRVPRQTIFEKMNLLSRFAPEGDQDADSDVIFDDFNQSLTVTIPKTKKGTLSVPTITLSMEGEDPVLIAEIINRIAEEAERATTLELISDIQSKVSARTRDLNQEIQRLHEKAKKQRLDEIERLETADVMERKTIKDKISSLRMKVHSERLAEISRLEEADRIKREEIEDEIRALRNSAKEKSLDRLATLKEAAEIAHSLDIKEPIGFKLKKISDSYRKKSQILTDISSVSPQLYKRGYEALEAEISSLSDRTIEDPFITKLRGLQDHLKQLEYNEKIAALKDRENDDPFIPELRGLQEKLKLLERNRKVEQLKSRQNDAPYISSLRDIEHELTRLESIHIDPLTVKSARLDQAAYPSNQRIKPNRKRIVMLGFALGLMFGIFGAFFGNFLENERKKIEEL